MTPRLHHRLATARRAPIARAMLVAAFAASIGFVSGCASLDPAPDIARAASTVTERSGAAANWTEPWESSMTAWDGRSPLAVESALAMALRNNREIRSQVELIAASRADLVQAGLLPNPIVGLTLRFPFDPVSGGTFIGAQVVQSLAALWLRDGKIKGADARLNQTVLDVSDKALRPEFSVDTRKSRARSPRFGPGFSFLHERRSIMNRSRTTLIALVTGTVFGCTAFAQPQGSQPPTGVDPATHATHVAQGAGGPGAHAQPGTQPADNAELAKQLAELRAQIAQLQAALAQGHASGGAPRPMPQSGMQPGMQMGRSQMRSGGPGMGMKGMGGGAMPQGGGAMQGMSGGGGMGMMDMGQMMMGGMGGGSGGGMSGMMGMMDQMMEMGMSRMGGGMNTGGMASALPGFPGASHIYHLGATGFFLDHGSHVTLTVEQQKQLGEIKEQSLLNQATLQRKIDQAEQELWDLTGADAPDAAKVEAKAREIEQFKSEQRISFIRDVGKAAAVLTDDQRKQLTGMVPANPAPANQPGAMPGMGGGAGGMGGM